MKLARISLALVAVTAAGSLAVAARAPSHLKAGSGLEIADGTPTRIARIGSYNHVPPHALREYAGFAAEAGTQWQSMWDRATGVPTRLWGKGIEVPDSMASAAVAQTWSIDFLGRHIQLFAPGSAVNDFVVVTNSVANGIRSVGLVQHADGVRVLGGQLSFWFKNDRMFVIATDALPYVNVTAPPAALNVDLFGDRARAWLLSDVAVDAGRASVDGPFILPIIGVTSVNEYRTVVRVTVDTQPIGRWDVFVDATTGEPVARRQTLMFATGTVNFNASVRRPTDVRMDYPAPQADFTVNGGSVISDTDGSIDWSPDAATTVTVRARGDLIRVESDSTANASANLSINPGGSVTWSEPDNERVDAQLTTFIHGNLVKNYCKIITPSMSWLNSQIRGTVNINDSCNAFSDGTNINFFTRGNGCENTGRLADVIYHEFGHSYHAHSIIEGVGGFDGAIGEGTSDYLAATITNDSGMGRGFFMNGDALREINPTVDLVYPDDLRGEVHADGEIIGGTLWDMRTLLIETHGYDAGVAISDVLYQGAIARATDMPTMYPAMLAVDDDDGDLSNGTPNECDINAAFGAHGLRSIDATVSDLGVAIPELDGFHVSISFIGLSDRCGDDGISSATLNWQLRSDPGVRGTEAMSNTGGNTLEGVIPTQAEGEVVQYQVVVILGGDNQKSYPENLADPFYELFVGTVEELYCTDFESDPQADGWTHGLTSGSMSEGADDWQWDTPNGRSGDPAVAFSGVRVFGNDLGHDNFNGAYQENKVNFALSPQVDASGYDNVRLQYRRWLTIEDGQFDQGNIYANNTLVWNNLASGGGTTHHTDAEWRFHDVDITDQAAGGTVQIKYEIDTDGGFEAGGWNLDDFCIVAYVASVCGDGVATGIEQCDDGEQNGDEPDACRADCTAAACGDHIVDSGEECDEPGEGCTDACERPAGGGGDGGGGGGDGDGDGGCGCVVGRRAPAPMGGLLLGGLGLMVAWNIRRRRN